MPAAASLLLMTSLMTQAQAPSPPPGPASTPPVQDLPVTRQAEPGTRSAPTERPHQIGVGGSMAMSSRGGGGAFRYFFGDQLGFNANIGWYRPKTAGGSRSQGSTFIAAPSVVYMLNKSHQLADIDVRPYVGGGLNYARSSTPIQTRTSSGTTGNSGLGTQVFGGVELSFLDAKWVAISAEVAHYQMAVTNFSSGLSQGTNFYLLFHFYLK
jgi:outer membrane protein W